MNEEENKAIELLKKLQKKTPYIIWGDGTPYNKSNQIQTILNLIEKQQKELEKNTERINELINEVTIKQCELEKKDKIIDLMADRLEFVMKNSGIGLDPEHGMNFTINDIKQYFTKKVDDMDGRN